MTYPGFIEEIQADWFLYGFVQFFSTRAILRSWIRMKFNYISRSSWCVTGQICCRSIISRATNLNFTGNTGGTPQRTHRSSAQPTNGGKFLSKWFESARFLGSSFPECFQVRWRASGERVTCDYADHWFVCNEAKVCSVLRSVSVFRNLESTGFISQALCSRWCLLASKEAKLN